MHERGDELHGPSLALEANLCLPSQAQEISRVLDETGQGPLPASCPQGCRAKALSMDARRGASSVRLQSTVCRSVQVDLVGPKEVESDVGWAMGPGCRFGGCVVIRIVEIEGS